jgi:hypothetical protein
MSSVAGGPTLVPVGESFEQDAWRPMAVATISVAHRHILEGFLIVFAAAKSGLA